MVDLLLELGTEELPARFVNPAVDDVARVFTEKMAAAGISHGAVKKFGTPRRVAILVSDVLEATQDSKKEVLGPPVKAAFDDKGQPKIPATKFADSLGLNVEQLSRIQTPKGEYLGAYVEEKGRKVFDLLPEILGACVRGINFAKSMRWGDVEQQFGRPLQWIVALFGSEVVPLIFADVRSGRQTRGHRFLANDFVNIAKPGDYETQLEKLHVIADGAKRRALTVERIEAAARSAGLTLIKDEALVDQVVNLVEQPNPVVGAFEERHLDLPPEVLIQEMKSHQRYFSLADANGKLAPRFIAVSNTPVKVVAASVKGYERVLKARLSDGRFFFDEDRRNTLDSRLPKLERVVWQRDLNSSWAEKVTRFTALSKYLAEKVGQGAQWATIERAATLCKADLVTGMVGEFPELQGVMGREYALHQKETPAVALAILEHYLPKGAGDGLPTQDAGAIIGIADRLDTVCGLFAVGKKPSGGADPFGLRRACLAIINITLGRNYRFSLSAAVDEALKGLASKTGNVKRKPTDAPPREQILEFFRGRLESLWREKHRPDLVDAVLSVGFDDLVGAQKRMDALSAIAAQGDFAALAATFKRVANIVEKQAKDVTPAPAEASKLVDDAEKALHAELLKVSDVASAATRLDDFGKAMGVVVTLKPHVDLFFDKVMVMAEDKSVRENRVRLLMGITGLFGAVADFSKIQSEAS